MTNSEEYLTKYGFEKDTAIKESTPPRTPPKEKFVYSDEIKKKMEQLELKKLEIELQKLEKPDTSVDYYSKMLELQKEAFNAQLIMQRQQLDLKLEIEKLKLDTADNPDSLMKFVDMIAPYLPQIVASLKNQPQMKPEQPKNVTGDSIVEKPTKPEKKPSKKEQEIIEEYKRGIINGTIDFEKAYRDYSSTATLQHLSRDEFQIEFDKIKNSSTPKKA
jgi:hypothetical protein